MLQRNLKNTQSKCLVWFFIIILSIIVLLINKHSFAKPEIAKGITVSPAYAELDLGIDETIGYGSFGVKNNYSFPVIITNSLQGLDVSGPTFIPTNNIPEYLKGNYSITPEKVKLDPGQSVNILVAIKDFGGLPSGGSYASLMINAKDTSKENPVVNSGISATMFIFKQKGASYGTEIKDIKIEGLPFGYPKKVLIKFENTGNVAIIPRGTINFSNNMHNFATSVINDNGVSVQPLQSKIISSSLSKEGWAWWPGIYQVIITYRYEGTDATKTIAINRLYIPIWVVVCLMFPIFYIVVYFVRKRIHQKNEVTTSQTIKSTQKTDRTSSDKQKNKQRKIRVTVKSKTYRKKFLNKH